MIIKPERRDRFLVVSKVPLEDQRLSWKAKGLLAYLLSKPPAWRIVVAHLVTQGPDGKASVTAALDELEAAGYLVRKQRERLNGRYGAVDYDLHEVPGETRDGNQLLYQVRLTAAGNPPVVSTEVVRTDLVKKEDQSTVFAQPVDELTRRRQREDWERARAAFRRREPSVKLEAPK